MKVKVLFICALAISMVQMSFGQGVSTTEQTPQGYLLGPGDVVTGKVLGEDQFNFVSTVDEDGKIQVPFFEQGVAAKCKTEKDLRADVAQLLSKYLRNPQITIQVERKSRPPATSYCEGRTPQQVVLTRQVTLLQLLAFSGGVTEKAGGIVQLTHTQPPVCSSEEVEAKWKIESNNGLNAPSSLYSLASIKQATNESNPVIFPGDIVVVMKAPPVYVIGEVNVIKEILITENGLSVTEAIAQAGGFSREAQKKDITIQRLKPNSRDADYIAVNYELIRKKQQKDVMLEPGDIIIVNKTKKSVTDTILEIITGGAKSAINSLPVRVL
ncbi:polysaccharide biosynthesis/export family protein [soil metagenome]